ncbi:probable plastid-lipid-associated protein 10, chloroplastic isoform X2 [Jatropha curcas]|uniref:probable plastid-lipid-associated protein 10, chloroplastic isoform X2 n=1 Tax=Jatropha curcas TaxID=180498 RepID=UPI0005FC0D6D|nr:probable plastid-lipid-associated protein 10, chloroplastic isoform X2 [Jatropha curcas]
MDLAFTTSFSPARDRAIFKIKPVSLNLNNVTRKLPVQKKFRCSATVAADLTRVSEFEIEKKKHDLLSATQDTQRGLVTTADQRSSIEEALVDLEGYNKGAPIDLVQLDGTWRLQYTSAPDVLVLLESSARLPFLQVGQIFQKFECRDQSNGGIVRNVVRWSIPTLLEISIQNIKISEELQALIAPAILPRSFLSLQILQFILTFKAQIPVTNAGNPGRRSVGGLYYLSYLDGNLLLGRAVGGGGVFVFTRAQPLDL